MSLIVSISGIRGIFGEGLNPENIIHYTKTFSEYCKIRKKNGEKIKIIIGRDGRITGKIIANIVSSTLISLGCDVVAIGVCPTPTVAIAVKNLDADGGISITASHNPIEWNGLKFFNSDGMFLNSDDMKDFVKISESLSVQYVNWDKLGRYELDESWIQKHIELVLDLSYINISKIREKKYRVVLDCINSSGGRIIPQLLKTLGCEVYEMNCELSGVFSRKPEPVPENLSEVMYKVKYLKADLGIVVDPDVDRLVLITEKGEPYGEEYTIATAVKFILGKKFNEKQKFKVVVNLSTTRAVEDIAYEYNSEVIRTPVGEINVSTTMKKHNAIIGGEGSGGIILPEVHYVRDAVLGTVLILQMLTEFGGKLSELKETMPEYFITKDKLEIKDLNADDCLKLLKKRYEHEKINVDDGLKIDFVDRWVHLRKSNTEPIIRIIAEAKSEMMAKKLVEDFKKEIYELATSQRK